ncbi:MAG: hypothetical protein Ct9H300mP6_02790 [Gammaproteobacteria bacterium]|nr:MAG: hypothetical protein Ct9H300mP6_02790 [Gammaproteobacteria bacterium]
MKNVKAPENPKSSYGPFYGSHYLWPNNEYSMPPNLNKGLLSEIIDSGSMTGGSFSVTDDHVNPNHLGLI